MNDSNETQLARSTAEDHVHTLMNIVVSRSVRPDGTTMNDPKNRVWSKGS